MPDIRRHAAVSGKVELDDLDWELAGKIGMTDDERRVLPYFTDVEGQTIFYMLELMKLKVARDAETMAFMTVWNYEEFFHSQAFMKFFEACGEPLDEDRITRVRSRVSLRTKLEDAVQVSLSHLFPRSFYALWMMWGASQELLTSRGYESLAKSSENPVLREICRRIAKQERRHFAYYYNAARAKLGESRFAQKFARTIFTRAWTPVGQGVKTPTEVAQAFAILFPGAMLDEVCQGIDAKMSQLPGMDGLHVVSRYPEIVRGLIPALAAPAGEPSRERAKTAA